MSNKTQLQTNNTKLDTLNSLAESISAKVDSLPDAGSGDGSSGISTCDITITNNVSPSWQYSYTAYENSQIVGKSVGSGGSVDVATITLTNVVCGSAVTVIGVQSVGLGTSTLSDETMQLIGGSAASGYYAFTAPSTPNTVASVIVNHIDA